MPRQSAVPSQTSVQAENTLAPGTSVREQISAAAQAFVSNYRQYGYQQASIDPLDNDDHAAVIAELEARTYGLVADESTAHRVQFAGTLQSFDVAGLQSRLRAAYCGPLSVECAHVRASEQRQWLYARMEERGASPQSSSEESSRVFARLAAAESFEQFHRSNHSRYKQFSLEGSESLVTLIAGVVENAARHGVEDIVLGLPHRGRLNVMLNALNLPAKDVLSLFSSNPEPSLAASDLKDHAGFSGQVHTASGDIHLVLVHNPSHLESVSPVVFGMARALQDRKRDGSSRKTMAVLVHGDASFSAQGIVAETLNLSQTRGYGIGGALHLILNNQIGSTVSHPRDSRSTMYCTDIARSVDAAIVHVNADDPDAVLFAARLAVDYRLTFGADIVVDHVGYRRFGHFVGDDPTITQPAMQRRIAAHRSVVELYGEQMLQRGLADGNDLDVMKAQALEVLALAQAAQRDDSPRSALVNPSAHDRAAGEVAGERPVRTAIPLAELQGMITRLAAPPPGLTLHASVDKMRADWSLAASERDHPIDWRLAENLAYGTLLATGFNVRLSGLDVGRGTFGHRQHLWHDQSATTDWQKFHVPLRHVAKTQGNFSLFESPLSEEGVLGFEYGYTLQCGRDLVVWEAQFGDFVNNAQVIIDQYIATGEAKWAYRSGLVALLPHGYDGWGPEHSCAYLGRFLELCAARNIRVAVPSTPAQLYHLLRRQALLSERKPLIVMTPKPAMYAIQQSYSRLTDLAGGEFYPLLVEPALDAEAVGTAIITSGKLYYDIVNERSRQGLRNVPVFRAEQLYPFPEDSLREQLRRFPLLRDVVWAQEEPQNHGAWYPLHERLLAAVPATATLAYAGRAAAAASAVCNPQAHTVEQRDVVASALAFASADRAPRQRARRPELARDDVASGR